MRNKQHIKRCPFCGGKAGAYQDYYDFWLIQCNGCGISTLHRKEIKTAIMEWNRRIRNETHNKRPLSNASYATKHKG